MFDPYQALWLIPCFLGFCVGSWIADYFLDEYWFDSFERSIGARYGGILDALVNMVLQLLIVAPFLAVCLWIAIKLIDLAYSISLMLE